MTSYFAFLLGSSQLPFIVNFFRSVLNGKKASENPWEVGTLEWSLPSPPVHHNFDVVPTVVRGPHEFADPQVERALGRDWIGQTEPALPSGRLAKGAVAFVDEAGREASARRRRARQVVGLAAEFFRELVHALSGAARSGDAELRDCIERAMATWPGDELVAAACLDRCLEASEQIDRNAHLTTLVECWLDDLGHTIALGQTPVR